MGDSGGTERTSISDEDLRWEDTLPLVPVGVTVTMEDQWAFDDDGWMTTPLLEGSRNSIYAGYRYAYAEMLQMWDRPLSRLEIMKFNVLKEDLSTSSQDAFSIKQPPPPINGHRKSEPILLGRREQLQAIISSGRGLDVTGICRTHETQLEPLRYTSPAAIHTGGAVGTCDRCNTTQSQLHCVYCLEPLDALYPPCLGCGCASHDACLAEWHAAGEVLCPAGDECNCVEEAANGQVESWAAMLGAMARHQNRAGGGAARGLIGAMLPGTVPEVPEEEQRERAEWENVQGGPMMPSRPQGVGAGLMHEETMSPARISLGNRLKKSAGDVGA